MISKKIEPLALSFREIYISFYERNIFQKKTIIIKEIFVMEQNAVKVKGLLITGIDAIWIPGLAIVGAASILTAAGYGVYNFITKKVKSAKEYEELKKSIKEFGKYVDSLKEGDLNLN